MKRFLILVVVAAFTQIVVGKVFPFKEGHETVYSMNIDATTTDKLVHHDADFLIWKGQGEDIRCKVRNIHVDKQIHEQFDHSDVLEIQKQEFVFTFDDSGSVEFKQPADFEEPHIVTYEPVLIENIKNGLFEFTRKVYIPYSHKKCNADFKVTEHEETYEVQIQPEAQCMNHPMVETKITMRKVLFKDTLLIKEYTIKAHMSFEDEKVKKQRDTFVDTHFEFVGFHQIGEKYPQREAFERRVKEAPKTETKEESTESEQQEESNTSHEEVETQAESPEEKEPKDEL